MRIIIADDHPLYREAVRLRMERLYPACAIVEAADLDELLAASADQRPDLILVDLRMPGMDGPRDIARVCERFGGAPVMLMSGVAEHAVVRQAIAAGARGFVPKTLSAELFAAATSMVIAGGTYLPAEVVGTSNGNNGTAVSRTSDLTPREQQVLVHLAAGSSNKEIGRDLGLAEVTIKLHVRQILKKISARNRSEAAAIATRLGLV
ncbi:MAG: response regulator [Candidatus Eiseniibacteriota bacterium]